MAPEARRSLTDPRRAVDYDATVPSKVAPNLQALKEDCQMLREKIDAPRSRSTSVGDDQEDKSESLSAKKIREMSSKLKRLCSSSGTCAAGLGAYLPTLLSPVASPTGPVLESPNQDQTLRRWYRVYPISDELYFVRPDPGLAGRTPGHPDAGMLEQILEEPQNPGSDPVQSRLKRNKDRVYSPNSSPLLKAKTPPGNMHSRINSVPSGMDRMCGLDDPAFNDTFVNLCKICCDKESELVFLPCRHGGMCEECLRRSAVSRALNGEGTKCPWCRKPIKEVIKIYDEGAIKMYGYAITKPSRFL